MLGTQMSLFDGGNKLQITKPVRLISLFSGYDSQALSLKYLGVPFEHYKTSEWAVKSIQALKDLHFGDDDTDYSASLSNEQLIDYLDGRISANYSEPMTRQQIANHNGGEKWRRKVYNNMRASNNLGSIIKVNANDLEIVETDKYQYIITYSFPCTDLSNAGKQMGMGKDSGTRSGLLWEVERILKECKELPQVLLMENVPAVIGKKAIKDFAKWVAFLDDLGYKSKWQVQNSKDFSVAQNRDRCFMVSVLGDHYYDMPHGFELKHRLKDFLQKDVDQAYYLDDETVSKMKITNLEKFVGEINGVVLSECGTKFEKFTDVALTLLARDYKGFGNQAQTGILEISAQKCEHIANLTGGKWDKVIEQSRRVYSSDGLCPTLHTCGGGNQEIKIMVEPLAYDEQNKYIRQDGLCGTLTTDGSSPKHNNRIIEPLVWDGFNQQIRRDSTTPEAITRNIGNDLKRNGQGLIEYELSDSMKRYINSYDDNIAHKNMLPFKVRKLTERECFRLMGVKDGDYEKIRANQSKSSCYHLAGDSIVTTCLMALFGEMFAVDWRAKIDQLVKEIIGE